MKKILSVCILFCVLTVFLQAQKLTIKNTVGADYDELGDYDLYSFAQETNESGQTVVSNNFAFGDRFQLDFASQYVDARFRLEFLYKTASDSVPNFLVVPTGFVQFKPIKQLSFVVGNDFFKTFAISSAYLAAADDVTKYGRLLTDSLGHESYYSSGDFGILDKGFAGGLATNWTWGEKDKIYLKAAAGSTMYTDFYGTFDYALDAGINAGVSKVFDAGFTAHDFTSSARKFGAFAGLKSIPDLTLNTSFYYNFTLSDYLAEARVNRSEGDEFKKQKTLYAIGFTGGYYFRKAKFGVYGDVISGLNDEYIDDIKYYDGSDNLIKTETTIIKRGSTIVKYKNGNAKRTDEYTSGAIPFYTQLRLTYDVSDFLNLSFNCKLRTMIYDASQSWLTFYPRLTIELPAKAGEITAGFRFDMNLTRYNGLSGFSVPISYTYKFKKDFSK